MILELALPTVSMHMMALRNELFFVGRGRLQNMLLSITRSPLVQVQQTGLEYSHLQNSSVFLPLFDLYMHILCVGLSVTEFLQLLYLHPFKYIYISQHCDINT